MIIIKQLEDSRWGLGNQYNRHWFLLSKQNIIFPDWIWRSGIALGWVCF